MENFVGVGEIGGVAELQEEMNRLSREMTPEERAKAAREHLRYIASVEPEMAWAA
jgi:hypothetical protein